MSVLDEICARKKEHIQSQKERVSLTALQERIAQQKKPRGFVRAIKNCSETAIIAEVKKASPSKGIIREDFDPVDIATIYEENGAACVSVLTDEPYFQGCDDYLTAVKQAVALPVLRKDFMIDSYQIYESRALGADCILLIMACLNDSLAQKLYSIAKNLGMDVLVEVHDQEELEHALDLNPEMIGVNNRNLKTLKVDTRTSEQLIGLMPSNITKISESGISDRKTIEHLEKTGYSGFLIGESLMKNTDIAETLLNFSSKNP